MLPSRKSSSDSSTVSTVAPMENTEKGVLPAPEDPLNDSPDSLVTSDTVDLDARAERRLLRKIDVHVYPILFVIYMLSFLDRINISNARIQDLDEDLDLSGNRFNVALFVYFIPYVLLEVPSNMLICKVRPSWYLSGLMFCWGIVNMCMGFVHSYEALVALRFFLGVFEAGVLPGIVYLTSMYYKRHEFQTRMSFFFCSTLVGGAFGGSLAYAIAKLGGAYGLAAWRWIFVIEGAVTAFVALIAAFLIVDWPGQCRFLSTAEKDLLRRRLAQDGAELGRMDTLNKHSLRLILTDPKIWLGALAYMGVGVTGYATTFFMPTILLDFGWRAEEAQVRTIPVYAVSTVGMLLVAWLSDRLRHRYGFILLGCVVATVGYGVLLSQPQQPPPPHPHQPPRVAGRDAKFAALFLVSLGGYAATPLPLAWLANNLAGHWKRALGSGLQVTVGNVAGIIAANIFVQTDAPAYRTGYAIALAMMWLGAAAATAMCAWMARENRRRDGRAAAGDGGGGALPHPGAAEDEGNRGDDDERFRFTL